MQKHIKKPKCIILYANEYNLSTYCLTKNINCQHITLHEYN